MTNSENSTEFDQPSVQEVEQAIRTLIRWAGDNPSREGLGETPKRVARAYNHWFKGYSIDAIEMLNRTFEETDGYHGLIVLKNVEFYSFCEHHIAPIVGRAHIGYVPNGRVVGISKIARLVEVYSKRLQIQERMTQQIANTLMDALKPCGVAVVIVAEHHCMISRGVAKHGALMETKALLGCLATDEKYHQEFLSSCLP
ncbi:MAG: GTP cyclohydrolase I FolE [Rhizobiaceae bacterium]